MNTPIPSARITCRKNQGESKLEYLTIDLADVTIHSIDWKGSRAAEEIEEIVLEFAKFHVNYTVQKNRPDEDPPPGFVDFGWDIQNHKETEVHPPPAKT